MTPDPRYGRATASSEERRAAVERLLAEAGLRPAGRRGRVLALEGLAARMARSLPSAGPVFAAFGRYLAGRPDAVPAPACLELASIPDRGPAMTAGALAACLQRELGAEPSQVFTGLEPRPFVSRLWTQSHRAVTAAGERVVVTFVRPETDAALAADLPLLPLLLPAVATLDPLSHPGEVLEAFRRHLESELDLTNHAAALAALAAEAPEMLVVPRVEAALGTPRLLVREDLGGRPLGEAAAAPTAADGGDAVRRTCLLWLRQAFVGRSCPAELGPFDVEVLPDGRVAFVGGALLRPPTAVQEHLWEHLVATLADDPATAGERLLREVERQPGALDEADLVLRMRQVVPFRDGAWSSSGDSLAEQLFAYWRLARECGYRLRAPALRTVRGLAALALLGRRLAPGRDALREGVEELRLARGLGRLREAVDVESLGRELLPYAHLMLSLPQKVDALLSMLARGEARVRLETEERGRPGAGGAVAVAAAAIAVALVLGRVFEPALADGAGQRIAEGASALLLLVAGGLLLRAASRSG